MPGKRGGAGGSRILPVAPARPGKQSTVGLKSILSKADALAGAVLYGAKPSDIGHAVVDPGWGLDTYRQYRAKASAQQKQLEAAAEAAWRRGDKQTLAAITRQMNAGDVALQGTLPTLRLARLAQLAGKDPRASMTYASYLDRSAEPGAAIHYGAKPLDEDLRKIAHPMPKDGKFKPGRLYALESNGKVPDMGSANRTVMVTDPHTGVSFLAPSGGWHHGGIEDLAHQQGYRPKPGTKYLQHEVYAPDPTYDVPAQLKWAVYNKADNTQRGTLGSAFGQWAGEPTRKSTFAQARIVNDLKKKAGRAGAPPRSMH